VERFRSFDVNTEIIVVLPHEHISLWKSLIIEHSFDVRHRVVPGGEERFHSVKAGLALVTEESLVSIHDGVRPLVSHDTIWRCFADAEEFGGRLGALFNPFPGFHGNQGSRNRAGQQRVEPFREVPVS